MKLINILQTLEEAGITIKIRNEAECRLDGLKQHESYLVEHKNHISYCLTFENALKVALHTMVTFLIKDET